MTIILLWFSLISLFQSWAVKSIRWIANLFTLCLFLLNVLIISQNIFFITMNKIFFKFLVNKIFKLNLTLSFFEFKRSDGS
jgi:hypothetical protein